ncbi:hypothetical protein [Vibrio phage vB_VmeM-Yong XC32]|nr:hypothetical protein [Vibrio phage vB_VmeM-Yong XC31]QAX96578.1 hypothetical protein [Vibrio phage vB_VmeM-Yong XC32]QAX96896.1 hypothetical protein [Vibrio phage vB_VmeM-Yong MS31]QAX97201.1 hypothetical protein [Vibrio phage vB_VmeM-Yong MS32]
MTMDIRESINAALNANRLENAETFTVAETQQLMTEFTTLAKEHFEASNVLAALERLMVESKGAKPQLVLSQANMLLGERWELSLPSMESYDELTTEVAMEGIVDVGKKILKFVKDTAKSLKKKGKVFFRALGNLFRNDYQIAQDVLAELNGKPDFKEGELSFSDGGQFFMGEGVEYRTAAEVVTAMASNILTLDAERFNKLFSDAAKAVAFAENDAAMNISEVTKHCIETMNLNHTSDHDEKAYYITDGKVPGSWKYSAVTEKAVVGGQIAEFLMEGDSILPRRRGGIKMQAMTEEEVRAVCDVIMKYSQHGQNLVSVMADRYWDTVAYMDKVDSSMWETHEYTDYEKDEDGNDVEITTTITYDLARNEQHWKAYVRISNVFWVTMHYLNALFSHASNCNKAMAEMAQSSYEV